MCVDPLLSTAGKALVNESGKAAATQIPGIISKAADWVNNMTVDEAIADRSAFSDYLQNAQAKISKTKTILYSQPTSIESFFEPIDIVVKKRQSSSVHGSKTSTKHVEDVLKLGSRLIIAGHAGTGKSIVMRHLFIDACRGRHVIPVYVELRTINQEPENTTILDLILQSLHRYGARFSKDDLVRNLDSQDFLFLLDGLDEVSDSRIDALRRSIDELGDKYPRARIILSSRYSEDVFRSWENYVVAETVELSKEQAISLINRLEFDDVDAKRVFAEELDDRLYDQHETFASNPLLLTMMLAVYSDRAAIPDDLTEFYSQAFDALFRLHDANKSQKFHRKLKCGLTDEEFKTVFSNFCFITFLKDEYTLKSDLLMDRIERAIERTCSDKAKVSGNLFRQDLLTSVCMLQIDGQQYTFVHRSFQEYFAAVYTVKLSSDKSLRDVVVNWMKGQGTLLDTDSSVYLKTLLTLNRDRLLQQVVFEELRGLRNTCLQEKDPYLTFINIVYDGASLTPRYDNSNPYEAKGTDISLRIRSLFYRTLIGLLRTCLGTDATKWSSLAKDSSSAQCQEELFRYLASEPHTFVEFIELEEVGLMGALLGLTDGGASSVFATIEQLEIQYAREEDAIEPDIYNL